MLPHQNEYSVYVLESLNDKKHYCGLSSNVISRVKMHNAGKVRATKARRPFILIYEEKCGILKEARLREKYLKTTSGRRYLKKILQEKNVGGSLPDC
jgi:putative endonuclease